jgi:hypothetical protein
LTNNKKYVIIFIENKRKEVFKMFTEIIELYNWCVGHSIPCTIEKCWDGYKIEFPDKSDIVQHSGSYGSSIGCVEPAGFSISYDGVFLDVAKDLIQEKSYGKIKK